MGLISTRQYDRAMRFFSETGRKIRTSPPAQFIRQLHAQSFAEVQRTQAVVERQYNIQAPQPQQTSPRSTPQQGARARYGTSPTPQFPGQQKPLELNPWTGPQSGQQNDDRDRSEGNARNDHPQAPTGTKESDRSSWLNNTTDNRNTDNRHDRSGYQSPRPPIPNGQFRSLSEQDDSLANRPKPTRQYWGRSKS